MEKRKFGFDWGGSLENNFYLRDIARGLFQKGYEVHIIAAAGITPTDETYDAWLRMIEVPYTKFHRVLDVGQGPEGIALGKVEKMRGIGCTVLYDDNDFNLKAVKEAGFEAVKIQGNNLLPIPKELEP